MLDTKLVRSKIDRLSAADGADTYWRETILNALHDIDVLEAQVSNRDSALEAARVRITDLTAELENRKQQFDTYCDAEEINFAELQKEIDALQAKLAQWAGYNPEQVKRLIEERVEQGRRIAEMIAGEAKARATAEEYLCEAHNELRNNRNDRATGEALGAVSALRAVGLLPDVQAMMWAKAIQFCPGHDDEGGRTWCAYCGDL